MSISALLSYSGLNLDASPPPLPPDSVYTSCYCEENIYLLAQAFTRLARPSATDRREPWPWQIYVVFISNSGKTVALWSQKAREGVVVWDYHVVLVLLPRTSMTPHGPARVSGNDPDRPASDSGGASAAPPATARQGCAPCPVLEAWVYDLDTTLPVPCAWRDYIVGTFPYALDRRLADHIDQRFHSLFRVIPADVYLDHFASDRSHMIVPASTSALTHAAKDLAEGGGDSHSDAASTLNGTERPGRFDEPAEDGSRYSMPPPPYPPLRGAKARALGITNNLMESFVAMDVDPITSPPAAAGAEGFVEPREGEERNPRSPAARYGQVMDLEGFVAWLAGSRKDV
ncbi:N-terminal glutamine amidase-domain-containing protein [Trametes punicea]|nr:N-terminal glutamine amidase-domain-containing protein [Trametes punicea]